MATLSPKQERFVEEYLVDINATKAAIRAGYSPKTATVQGYDLLRRPHIQEALEAKRAALAEKTQVTAARVLQELSLAGFSDIGEVLDFSGSTPRLRPANEITERARRSIASIRTKRMIEGSGEDAREVEVTEFKLWDKLAALEKIGKHLGMFVDRLEVTEKTKLVLVEEIVDEAGHANDPAAPQAGGVPPQ